MPRWTKTYTNWNLVPLSVTLEEAAIICKIGYDTLRRMAAAGTFPACKQGKKWIVEKDLLRAWMRGEWKGGKPYEPVTQHP